MVYSIVRYRTFLKLSRVLYELKGLKGGYIARSKNLKFHFMALSGRVGLEKFIGTDLTVKFGLVCLPDTKQKSKSRFPEIAYSGHVTQFDKKVFVEGDA